MSIEQEKYKELGFNDYFIEYLKNHKPDHVLSFRCEPPYYVYNSPLIERNVFPLWECGTTIVYYNRDTKCFEVCHIEDIDDIWESYNSIQGLLAYLLLQLWEDEHANEKIAQISKSIGFKYTEQLLREAEETEEYSVWRKEFPKICS